MNAEEMDVMNALHVLARSNIQGIDKSYVEEMLHNVQIMFKEEQTAYIELCEELRSSEHEDNN